MIHGYLNLVLHAHLPYVRHPEYPSFLEEKWLFEAITETYLPLLAVFDRLDSDGVPFHLTVSISPTLSSMFGDEFLQDRYLVHLDKCIELAEKEIHRTRDELEFNALARMYLDMFVEARRTFVDRYDRNLLKGFDYFFKKGRIELITTAATHPYLPLYEQYPVSTRAQIRIGVEHQTRTFGKPPRGMWLPECGYYEGIEEILQECGIDYFFCAAHALLFSETKPQQGVYAPVRCPNGVTVFGRDPVSTNAVWSADEGYPADYAYREFYRDIGYDLPLEYIGPYVHDDTVRVNTGFKYYAITGKTDDKRPYDVETARRKAEDHAENFIYSQKRLIERLSPLMQDPPILSCPYDAELFGHWWFEGPVWLESLFRKLAVSDGSVVITTPSAYLKKHSPKQVVKPAFSSWGNKGYSEVWLDGSNDWVYRHTHKAVERMSELVARFPDERGLKARALNQAAREVLLSQASDWPFIMRTGTTVPYAVRRVKEHIHNFTMVYDALCRGNVGTEWLTRLERINNIFPDIDYRVFADGPPSSE